MHVVCMQCVSSILLLYGLDLESVNNIIMIGSDEIGSTIYPIAMKVNPREQKFLMQHPSPPPCGTGLTIIDITGTMLLTMMLLYRLC